MNNWKARFTVQNCMDDNVKILNYDNNLSEGTGNISGKHSIQLQAILLLFFCKWVYRRIMYFINTSFCRVCHFKSYRFPVKLTSAETPAAKPSIFELASEVRNVRYLADLLSAQIAASSKRVGLRCLCCMILSLGLALFLSNMSPFGWQSRWCMTLMCSMGNCLK